MSYTCSNLLACPTCGPGCNYECVNGICEEVPRDNGADGRVGVSKTRGVPSKGNPNRGARGQALAFRNASGKYRNDMSSSSDYRSDNDPHWMTYARNGQRVSYPVHPPLYMARNNDFRPKATPIHPPLYQSRRGMTPIHPPLYQSRRGMTPIHPPLYQSRRGMTPIHPPLYQSRRSTGFRRFSGDENGTMMTMSVGKLLMGYLAIGLSAFVVGYAIKKGCDTAK